MVDWDDDNVTAVKINSTWDDINADSVPDSWDAELPHNAETTSGLENNQSKARSNKNERKKLNIIDNVDKLIPRQRISKVGKQLFVEESGLDLVKENLSRINSDNKDLTVKFDPPNSKEDFNLLSIKLIAEFQNFETSPYFSMFSDQVIRSLTSEIDLDTLKNISAYISPIVTEKQKQAKEKLKKKAKNLMVERENEYEAGEQEDDFDDIF